MGANDQTDRLLQLAPDPKSLESGRRLFYSKRWQLLGGDGQWLWGEFDVNARRPIRSAVQLLEGRFHCTCRARSRPCAHGLALVILLRNNPDRITVAQPPEWVRATQFKAEAPPKTTKDSDKADERLAARLELMNEGVNELELRLIDVLRRGIADTLAQGPDTWSAMATRLTDAKLPGPAGRIRRLAGLSAGERLTASGGAIDEIEHEICRTLGDCYLFVRAWRKLDTLPSARRDEVLQFAGVTTRRDDLLLRAGVTDHWLVLGQVTGQEEKLRYRRVWLRGERSRRFAMLLDYAYGERPFEQSWPLAAAFDGEVHYYPGSYRQRAIFPRPRAGGRPYDGLKGYATFADLLANYQRALAANPWLLYYPAYLVDVRPILEQGQFFLADIDGAQLPLPEHFTSFYKLLAVGGGEPVGVFGEFDGYTLRPLSLITGTGLTQL